MTNPKRLVAALALTLVSASAFAGGTEELRYSWRVRGGLGLLAGLMFPTKGIGNLRTTVPADGNHMVQSELLITAPNGKQGGFYAYESEIDDRGAKTLMTYHGYAWGKKSRNERTIFDYVKRLARIQKQTPEEVENKVKKLPEGGDQMRDILTAIYFMRQNAHTLTGPMQTKIYSDGKEYPVILKPGERKNFVIDGKNTMATAYEIVDAPGGKKWPGGVKVWLSADARRLPVRIEIQQSVASLQLDLQQVVGPTVQVADLR
jgi:Protein of unknown function (DUF3108)